MNKNLPLRILVVDDNPDDRFMIRREIEKNISDTKIIEVINLQQFHETNQKGGFDLVVTDFQLQWSNGLFILKEIKKLYPNCPVIMYTATGSEEVAVEAMKSGLDDYILKSVKHILKLSPTIIRVLEKLEKAAQLRLVQTQIKTSEETHRSIVTSVIDAIITIDTRGIIKDINKSGLNLFGYDENELLGEYITKIMPRKYVDDHVKGISAYLPNPKGPFSGKRVEVKGLTKEGKEFDISISVSEVYIDEELNFTGIITDIRERKIAEQKIMNQSAELQRLNRVLNSILASTNATKMAIDEISLLQEICDITTNIGGYNLAWIGYSIDDENKTVKVMASAGFETDFLKTLEVSWGDSPKGQGPVGRAIATGLTVVSRNRLIDNYPIEIPQAFDTGIFASIALPLKDDGTTIGSLNVYSIESNVFSEEEVSFLEELAENLSFGIRALRVEADKKAIQYSFDEQQIDILKLVTAVEQSPSITFITDINGDIEYVNPMFTKVTGYTFNEVLGKNPRFLKSGLTSQEEYKNLWDNITNGKEWHGTFQNKKKNGEVYWVSVAIYPVVDSENRIINFIGVQKDITSEKLIEEQLQQSQKMEAVGRLAGGIVHDFNNILSVISISTDILNSEIPIDDPLREEVDEIKNGVKLATSITRQLLAFSRKDKSPMETFQPTDILKNLDSWFSRLVGKSYQIKLDFPENELEIRGSSSKFEQILVNLIGNSKDAMHDGGEIKVSINGIKIIDGFSIYNNQHLRINDQLGEFFTAGKFQIGDYLHLQVKDIGTGIKKSDLPYLFEPFFTTKEPGEGTGLGLSTVYGIVLEWNGFITVNSKQGVGSEFNIFIPLVTESKG